MNQKNYFILIRKNYIKGKRYSGQMKTIWNEFSLSHVFMFFRHPQLLAANSLLCDRKLLLHHNTMYNCDEKSFEVKLTEGLYLHRKSHILSTSLVDPNITGGVPRYYLSDRRSTVQVSFEILPPHSLFEKHVEGFRDIRLIMCKLESSQFLRISFSHPYNLLRTNIY